jgi:hypothetical protein
MGRSPSGHLCSSRGRNWLGARAQEEAPAVTASCQGLTTFGYSASLQPRTGPRGFFKVVTSSPVKPRAGACQGVAAHRLKYSDLPDVCSCHPTAFFRYPFKRWFAFHQKGLTLPLLWSPVSCSTLILYNFSTSCNSSGWSC